MRLLRAVGIVKKRHVCEPPHLASHDRGEASVTRFSPALGRAAEFVIGKELPKIKVAAATS
jgi:hypothetical protein